MFKPPVINSRITILNKIQQSWETAKDISLGRGNIEVKENFIVKLDKLFDILNCKCEIVMCANYGCPSDCTKEAHTSCMCPKEKKIPVKDLAFIKGQRDNTGSIGPHQMGLPDLPEHNRQVRHQERQK